MTTNHDASDEHGSDDIPKEDTRERPADPEKPHRFGQFIIPDDVRIKGIGTIS